MNKIVILYETSCWDVGIFEEKTKNTFIKYSRIVSRLVTNWEYYQIKNWNQRLIRTILWERPISNSEL